MMLLRFAYLTACDQQRHNGTESQTASPLFVLAFSIMCQPRHRICTVPLHGPVTYACSARCPPNGALWRPTGRNWVGMRKACGRSPSSRLGGIGLFLLRSRTAHVYIVAAVGQWRLISQPLLISLYHFGRRHLISPTCSLHASQS